jgi:hypothetical protein
MATKSRSMSPMGFASMALIILFIAASFFGEEGAFASEVAACCAGG